MLSAVGALVGVLVLAVVLFLTDRAPELGRSSLAPAPTARQGNLAPPAMTGDGVSVLARRESPAAIASTHPEGDRVVAGFVFDSDGEPIVGAKVDLLEIGFSCRAERKLRQWRARGIEPVSRGSVVTLAGGAFALPVEHDLRGCVLLVRAAGYLERYEPELRAGVIYRIRLRRADCLITGIVLDLQSLHPIPGALVTAIAAEDEGARSATTSDKDGRFEIRGLAPGAYTVAAADRDHWEALAMSQALPAGDIDAAAQIEFRLEPARRLRCTVVDAATRAPIPEAVLRDAYRETSTDEAGQASIPAGRGAIGRALIEARASGYGDKTVAVPSTEEAVTIALHRLTTVAVILEADVAFDAARVGGEFEYGDGEERIETSRTTQVSDREVRCESAAIPAGEPAKFRAVVPGFELVRVRVEPSNAGDGEAASPMRIRLQPGRDLRVRIFDESRAAPLAGAVVAQFPPAKPLPPDPAVVRLDDVLATAVRSGRTDPDGRFVLDGVGAAEPTVKVFVYARGYRAECVELALSGGDEASASDDLVLTLRSLVGTSGDISGRVVLQSGPHSRAACVVAINRNGDRWQCAADDAGDFRFSNLPFDRYQLLATFVEENELMFARTFEPCVPGTTGVTIRMPGR